MDRSAAPAATLRARVPARGARAGRAQRRRSPLGLRALLAPRLEVLRALWGRRRARLALLALVLIAALASASWVGLRHSPLSSVTHVRITGLHGPEAGAIEAALSDAAHHMSTLDVRVGALRAAVAPFALVREVKASASFPHTLRIRVVEQPPVAALVAGGTRTAVAADGVVLGPALISGSLPTLEASFVPAPGQPLSDESLRPALAVVAAAPAPMVRFITRAYTGKQGVTLVMKSGLSAYFGDASRPHAKWLALALVLANERSAGASYVDVRVPERPAAGYASGTAPRSSGEGSSTSASGSAEGSQESIAAALAAGLVKAVGTEQANAPAAKSAGPNPEEAEKAESKSHAEAGHEAPGGSEGASPESSARAGEEAGSGRSKTGP